MGEEERTAEALAALMARASVAGALGETDEPPPAPVRLPN
jgi:hypothetical protein